MADEQGAGGISSDPEDDASAAGIGSSEEEEVQNYSAAE